MVLPTCLCPQCGQNTGQHVLVHYLRGQVRETSRIVTLQQSEDFGKASKAFLASQNKCQYQGSPGVSKPKRSCIPPWICTQIQELSDSTVFSLDGLSKQHVEGLHEGWYTGQEGETEFYAAWPLRSTSVQDHIENASEDLQEGRLRSRSGQPVPVLIHPHSKEVLPDV